MKVEFYRHSLEESDIARAAEVLRSVFLTTGPATAEFETAFSAYTGLSHTVAVSSCTAALQAVLLALGVGPGDEVIVPAMTFLATATAVLHTGATPVLVDVEPETGLIDPARAEAAVTTRTKALLPVHLYGVMADMRALRHIADKHGLCIVEDCAHCIEGERDGVRPGQLADAACYSFYATKNLTCGEGGAVATNDAALAARVLRLRQHGMSKDAATRYTGRYEHWDMLELGLKCNLDSIHSALLSGQIARLDELWEKRDRLYRRYLSGLAGLNGLAWPEIRGKSAYHLFTVWVDPERRDEILKGLQDRGVGVAVNYRAMHTLSFFRERFGFAPADFPHADRIGRRTLSLPFYPKLREDEADAVILALRSALAAR